MTTQRKSIKHVVLWCTLSKCTPKDITGLHNILHMDKCKVSVHDQILNTGFIQGASMLMMLLFLVSCWQCFLFDSFGFGSACCGIVIVQRSSDQIQRCCLHGYLTTAECLEPKEDQHVNILLTLFGSQQYGKRYVLELFLPFFFDRNLYKLSLNILQ